MTNTYTLASCAPEQFVQLMQCVCLLPVVLKAFVDLDSLLAVSRHALLQLSVAESDADLLLKRISVFVSYQPQTFPSTVDPDKAASVATTVSPAPASPTTTTRTSVGGVCPIPFHKQLARPGFLLFLGAVCITIAVGRLLFFRRRWM